MDVAGYDIEALEKELDEDASRIFVEDVESHIEVINADGVREWYALKTSTNSSDSCSIAN
jgi:hypothetical protein